MEGWETWLYNVLMHFYFFRPFNKDLQNPWSLSNWRFNARWTGIAILVFGILFGLYLVFQDFSFLPGAAYTNGSFVKVTGSQLSHRRYDTYTDYTGLYHYTVNGHMYSITQIDDELQGQPAQFKPTINIAYQTANPARGKIVYGSSLQVEARGSFVDGLVIGLGGYSIIYLICAPINAIQIRRLRKANSSVAMSAQQTDVDTQAILQRIHALEAAKAAAPDEPAQSGNRQTPH